MIDIWVSVVPHQALINLVYIQLFKGKLHSIRQNIIVDGDDNFLRVGVENYCFSTVCCVSNVRRGKILGLLSS